MNSLVLLRRTAAIVMGTALWVGLGFVASGCHKNAPAPAQGEVLADVAKLPAVAVTSATVTRQRWPQLEPIGGTVAAVRRPVVSAQINGIVTRIPVDAGQKLKQGDLVAEISSPEAEASLRAAKADLNLAQQDYSRTEQLLASRSVSREAFDQAKARLETVRAAQAQAQTAVGYRQVRAPITGVVRKRLVESGEVVAPGKPLIEMEDESALRLEAFIPESLSGAVDLGTTVTVFINAADEGLSATLAEITPVADPLSRTFLVKFDLPATSGVLSGQFGRAYIPTGDVERIEIPAEAVRRVGQIESVFVIRDGRAWLRLVRTSYTAGFFVEKVDARAQIHVLSGLEAGEVVAIGGRADLVDGRTVSVH